MSERQFQPGDRVVVTRRRDGRVLTVRTGTLAKLGEDGFLLCFDDGRRSWFAWNPGGPVTQTVERDPNRCGFCDDGDFVVRGRNGMPDRHITCPYCGGGTCA